MAGLGRRTFAPGEVLTASNVMNYLQDQAVMVFAGTAARGSAIGTAVSEGMVTYLADSNKIEVYTNAWEQVFPRQTGSVLQVVSATKTDTASLGSTTFTDISGLSVSITPVSASSRILVSYTANVSVATANWSGYIRLLRGSTTILQGDAASNRTRTSNSFYPTSLAQVFSVSNQFLDSPNTTSATTYKLQWAAQNASNAIVLNRNGSDIDSASEPRLASTITVMEIAG